MIDAYHRLFHIERPLIAAGLAAPILGERPRRYAVVRAAMLGLPSDPGPGFEPVWSAEAVAIGHHMVVEPFRRPAPVIVLAYDGVAADEAGIVVHILTGAGLDVIIATVGRNQVTSYHGRVIADRTAAELADCSALIVPGGMGVRRIAADRAFMAVIRRLSADATWLGATSTGSILLAMAGVIDGARATTHWLAGDLITARGVILVREPFVECGRLLTASGTASAAQLGFRLVGALAGAKTEAEARASYQAPPQADSRYGPRMARWRRWFARRRMAGAVPINPWGQAEIVFLDLDDDEFDDADDL